MGMKEVACLFFEDSDDFRMEINKKICTSIKKIFGFFFYNFLPDLF